MTAQSSVNFSKFGKYFGYKLRGLSPLIVLTSIFAFLSYPAGFFCITMTAISYEKLNAFLQTAGIDGSYFTSYDSELNPVFANLMGSPEWLAAKAQYDMWSGIQDVMIVVMIIALGAMFLMGYFIIMRNFRYIYQKRFVDMDYSLPISEQTRFLGDFLSGLAAYLIPHIAAFGIGLGLYANGIARRFEYLADINMLDAPVVKYMLIGVLSCVMFYCLSLLAVVCCGRTTEAGIAPAVINAAIPVIMWTMYCLSLINCSGGASGDRAFMLPFAATSPLGLLITAVFSDNGHLICDGGFVLTAAELCGAIIMTLVYAAAAMAIALKRRNERVGEPYVIKPMRHIINVGVTLAVVSIFSASNFFDPHTSDDNKLPYVIAMLILTFVLYVILELISGKGFRKFPKTLLGYAAATGGSLLLCLLVTFTNGFGAEQRVPASSNVKSVAATIYCRDSETWRESFYLDDVQLTDPALIGKITEMHTQSNVLNANTDIYVHVEYLLKGGNTMERQLRITAQQAEDFLRAYTGSADWKRAYSVLDKPVISISPDSSYLSDVIDAGEFVQALKSDIETLDYDAVYNGSELGSGIGVWIQTENGNERIVVEPYHKNAYAYLVDHGCCAAPDTVTDGDVVMLAKVRAQSVCDPYTAWISNMLSYESADTFSVGYTDVYDDEIGEYTDEDISENKYNNYNDECGVYIDANSAEFTELLELCTGTPVIYGDECEYTYALCILRNKTTPLNDFVYIAVPSGLDRVAEIFDSLAARQAA